MQKQVCQSKRLSQLPLAVVWQHNGNLKVLVTAVVRQRSYKRAGFAQRSGAVVRLPTARPAGFYNG